VGGGQGVAGAAVLAGVAGRPEDRWKPTGVHIGPLRGGSAASGGRPVLHARRRNRAAGRAGEARSGRLAAPTKPMMATAAAGFLTRRPWPPEVAEAAAGGFRCGRAQHGGGENPPQRPEGTVL